MMDQRLPNTGLDRTAYRLREILHRAQEICPVCRLVTDDVDEYIDWLFYERVNDPPTRGAIRRAGGFCRHHARLVVRHGDALGTAIIMRDVVANDLREIDAGEYDHPPAVAGPLSRLFGASPREVEGPTCPICEFEDSRAALVVDSLLNALTDPKFSDLFCQSQGMCIPHFGLAFNRCRDEERWQVVLDTEKRTLKDLTEQLAELARKFDYRFRDEPRGDEMLSWRRALNATSSWVDD